MVCGHPFSFLCLSVPSPLRFFPNHPLLVFVARRQVASCVGVLLVLRPSIGPSLVHRFGAASAASDFLTLQSTSKVIPPFGYISALSLINLFDLGAYICAACTFAISFGVLVNVVL